MDNAHLTKNAFALIFRVNLTFLFLVFTNMTIAQHNDSTQIAFKSDTILQKSIRKIDSIAQSFQFKADSLISVHKSLHIKIESVSSRLQSMIDSMNYYKLPVENLSNKLDSLQQVLNNQVTSLTLKINDLKLKVTQNLKEIQLPPPLQEDF